MRAVRSTKRGVAVVDVEEPTGDGVLVTVRTAGICASDLALVQSGPLPFTIGHEIAGELPDGTPVAVEAIAPCHTCPTCRTGAYNRCSAAMERPLGFGGDGGMADWFLVPEASIVPLPEELAAEHAFLVEPVAVATHAVLLAEPQPGQRIAVVGAGSVGLAAVAVARSFGFEVGILARHERQLAVAAELGAEPAAGHYEVVIDAAGGPTALRDALALVTGGGAVVVAAVYYGDMPVPGGPALVKEVRILPSFAYSARDGIRDVDRAAAVLAANPALATSMITHRFPLDDAAEAFRVAGDRGAGAIKVVLDV
jgi:2-desacetyl-2-hydroxyethyl bacteriochlorophyllide A dehydrogenase